MKDTSKKIGAVALAGVMVAGGTIQSGTIISNAEGNNKTKTSASTMKDDTIKVYDFESTLKEIKERWEEGWRSELGLRKYVSFKKIVPQFRDLNNSLGNKADVIAIGGQALVDSIVDEAKTLLKDDFGFDLVDSCYKTFDELKTGKPSYDDRVVNIKGTKLDYGGVPFSQFQKGKFYRLRIGDYMSSKPICHIFIYVRK